MLPSPYPAAGERPPSPTPGVSAHGLAPAGRPPPFARRDFSHASLSSSERVWGGTRRDALSGTPTAGCTPRGSVRLTHLQRGELPDPPGDVEALGGPGGGGVGAIPQHGAGGGARGAPRLGEHPQGSPPRRAPQPPPTPTEPQRQETYGSIPWSYGPAGGAPRTGTPGGTAPPLVASLGLREGLRRVPASPSSSSSFGLAA